MHAYPSYKTLSLLRNGSLPGNGVAGGAFFGPAVQRFSVGPQNDVYEQEADAVAESIDRQPGGETAFFAPRYALPVQRKCAHCAEEDKELQRKPARDVIQRQDEEEADPIGEGLSTVAENLGENNPAFSAVTEDLANRFLAQPAPLSVGLPAFLGANYAFLWGMAIANPSMRRHMNDFNLAMIPGIVPAFPIKTFTYRILDPAQSRFEFEFGLDASGLIEMFNEGVFNTHVSTLSFDATGNLDTERPSVSVSSFDARLGFFDNGVLLSGGMRTGIDPYPLFTGSTYPGETGRIMQQIPALPDLYPGQQDVRFMLQVDFVKLYNYFHPESSPIRSVPLEVEGDRVDRKVQPRYACEEEQVQRRGAGKEKEPLGSHEPYVSGLNGRGEQLGASTQRFFENRMGYDFSNVRVHTGGEAARSAQSINALAYTTGTNIVFNEDQYSPESAAGKKLLAHELTHVVQQNAQQSVQRIQRRVIDRNVVTTDAMLNVLGLTRQQIIDVITAADADAIVLAQNGEDALTAQLANAQGGAAVDANIELILNEELGLSFNQPAHRALIRQQIRRFTRVRETLESGYLRYLSIGIGNVSIIGCEAAPCGTEFASSCPGNRLIVLCQTFWDTPDEQGATLLHEPFHIWFEMARHAENALRRADASCFESFALRVSGRDAPATCVAHTGG